MRGLFRMNRYLVFGLAAAAVFACGGAARSAEIVQRIGFDANGHDTQDAYQTSTFKLFDPSLGGLEGTTLLPIYTYDLHVAADATQATYGEYIALAAFGAPFIYTPVLTLSAGEWWTLPPYAPAPAYVVVGPGPGEKDEIDTGPVTIVGPGATDFYNVTAPLGPVGTGLGTAVFVPQLTEYIECDVTPTCGPSLASATLDLTAIITYEYAPVPEPAEWVIMLVGFLGMGVAARGRRPAVPVRCK